MQVAQDPPPRLEYGRPVRPPFPLGLRILLLGPICGVLVAAARTITAAGWWFYFEEPTFYFHNRQEIRLSLAVDAVIGSQIGAVVAGLLLVFERFSGRRIRAVCTWPCRRRLR